MNPAANAEPTAKISNVIPIPWFTSSFLVSISVTPSLVCFLHVTKCEKIRIIGAANMLIAPRAYDSNAKNEYIPYITASIVSGIQECLFFVESIIAPEIPNTGAIVKITSHQL
jgi:hypothetical protein